MKLYNFSKTACGPCILVSKFFAAMNDARLDSVTYVSLDEEGSDFEVNNALAKEYGINATPTLLVVHEGKVLEEVVGGLDITKAIKRVLDTYTD
jgi:thiol-disulfide isomerase/thioredoxin